MAMAKDEAGKVSKEYIRLALDGLGPAAGLPPYGAIDQVLIPSIAHPLQFSFYFTGNYGFSLLLP